ncbi:Imm1 family immunity protein [Allokutzneria sp. NRRL B-24872]|uniref:Imm1 family immunity protein n=1 Tax=Allokutzneria sp. NRRL B-24872 TaxID=1137961 RepID=UPI00143DADEF|nr:Imm1 family immunity protein [Allokutzneria sp. NRRL B-24872]
MTIAHVWYDVKQPGADVRDAAGLEALLRHYATSGEPIVLSVFRECDVEGDQIPEIEMLVGVGRDPRLALIQCGDDGGLWFTLSADTDREGEVFYDYMHNAHYYPSNAEVLLEEVLAAVHEFAVTGKRPDSVAWQAVMR